MRRECCSSLFDAKVTYEKSIPGSVVDLEEIESSEDISTRREELSLAIRVIAARDCSHVFTFVAF